MMISPDTFIEDHKGYTYAELINVRNKLLGEILDYEKAEKSGLRDEADWAYKPNPATCYKMNLEYLAELMKLMQERYEENICIVDENDEDEQLHFINNVLWSEGEFLDGPSEKYKQAWKLLNDLVKSGNAEAMNMKGALYYEGRGVEQDQKKAVSLYKKAAAAGCSIAMSNLGYAYFYGNGTVVDMAKAYKYFSMADHYGEWDAIYKLGDMYRDGLFVPQDEEMAFKFYDKCYNAVPHNENNDAYPACLMRIGECLYKGIGIATDYDTAYNLLKEAERIFNIQIKDDRFYAKKSIGRVEKDLEELEGLMSGNINNCDYTGTEE